MLQKFHDVGFIMWHDRAGTRDLVVLDVQWMINQMTELLCQRSIEAKYNASTDKKGAWTELQHRGRLHIELLPELWPTLQPWERQSVLKYMVGFGHCCLLYDSGRSESEQIDRSVLLVPTLLPAPSSARLAAGAVWNAKSTDKSLRVCFVTSHHRGLGDDWPESRSFLPDTLFFRLVAALLRDVNRANDRFKDLYRDRVVVRTSHERYLLLHDRERHQLHLTVYGGDGCESAPATVLRKVRSCLDKMVGDFGVHFRFEVRCELRGEIGWYPLDDLDSCSAGQLWLTIAEPEPQPEHPPESEAPTEPVMTARFPVCAKAERKFDYFINHSQASGQDQCANLYQLLTAAGASVWYDMQAQDLTAQGMEEGVSQSRNMLIFLSDGVMGRPFCNAEQRWAKQYGCNLIGVVENDPRHSPADFGKEKERAPADLKHILDEVEFLTYTRRGYEVEAMISEIQRRAAIDKKSLYDCVVAAAPVLVLAFAIFVAWTVE
eukprot:COSAG02_NODE_6834_length_3337_cov_28.082149_3_plen_490_part_00